MADDDDLDRIGLADHAALDRRELLQRAGALGLAAAGGSALLAGCGGGSSTSASGGSSSGATTASQTFAGNSGTPSNPSRGGNLRVAMIGNGTSEAYNPFSGSTPIDELHAMSVFDLMVRPGPYYSREPGLITNWASNKDATVWELTLRDGVTWHDGKPLTPADLIYTFRAAAAPTSLGGNSVAAIRLNELKQVGKNIVRVPLSTPIADLPGNFMYGNACYVVQDGTKNYSEPIGTGPYKLESFVPGQRSVLSANRDYWDSPKPYPDQLEILSIDDPTARLNALQGGQIDLCLNLPFAEAKANLSNSAFKVVVGQPGVSYVIYMRVDSGAFRDVRVREAMKLIPDRHAMIEAAMSGFAEPGKDLIAPGVKYFNKSLPARTQDIEKAKSLLKAAGQPNLTVTLHTAEVLPGFTSAATVFAQQASAAGVNVQVKHEQPSQYFNPQILFLKMPFGQDAWPGPSLIYNYSAQYAKGAPINETHWNSSSFNQLYYQALGETDPTKAQELWNQVQQVQYDQGGSIVWAYWRPTDGASNKVRGFGVPGSGWLSGSDDLRVWNWGLA